MAVLDFTFERREKLIERDSREEGREEGRAEEKILVAQNMLKAGRPIEEIQNFTGLSEEAIMKIADEV